MDVEQGMSRQARVGLFGKGSGRGIGRLDGGVFVVVVVVVVVDGEGVGEDDLVAMAMAVGGW